jgi:hypothetical protein
MHEQEKIAPALQRTVIVYSNEAFKHVLLSCTASKFAVVHVMVGEPIYVFYFPFSFKQSPGECQNQRIEWKVFTSHVEADRYTRQLYQQWLATFWNKEMTLYKPEQLVTADYLMQRVAEKLQSDNKQV